MLYDLDSLLTPSPYYLLTTDQGTAYTCAYAAMQIPSTLII